MTAVQFKRPELELAWANTHHELQGLLMDLGAWCGRIAR